MNLEPRFSRQIRFAPLGSDGQARISSGSALLVGVGALGSHIATTLVRAGIGEIWLIDRDIVELDNLQRQILFDEDDARAHTPKAIAAAAHLRKANSACTIHPIVDDFSAASFDQLGGRPDVILDGTDNFATRFLLNDLSLREDIPWIYGGVLGAAGTAMAILPGESPCLRCMTPEPPPTGELGNCETHGVLASAVATIAAFQSAQALKILAGRPGDVARGILTIDVWENVYALRMGGNSPQPDCPTCTRRSFPALEKPRPEPTQLCGRKAVQVQPSTGTEIDLDRLASQLRNKVEDLERTPHLLRFSTEGCQFSVFRGGRTLLFGTDDLRRAKTLYDRWIGA